MENKTMQVCLVCLQAFGCIIEKNGNREERRCIKCKNCEDDKGWNIEYGVCADCQSD